MRLLFLSLLVLAAAVTFALVAREDTGYVLISYSDWSMETSLTFFLLLLIGGFILCVLLLNSSLHIWHFPERMHNWHKQRRTLRARRATQKGLIALAEGHWAEAEKALIRYADESDTPLLNYLIAARAAQKQGADNRRDLYLSHAHHSMPDAELAVGLTQADVQLSHGQLEQALATLMHLRSIAPKHEHVLYLLKRLYEKLEDWDKLLALLPDLRKQKVLGKEAAEALEKRIQEQRLVRAARTGQAARLKQLWPEIPKSLRQDPALAGYYAQQLMRLDEQQEAEQILREILKRNWNIDLVRLYGQVKGEDAVKQLATAEEWLKQHPHHPELLLTLGRLALQNKLWGKARAYLEASLGAESRAETCCELGNLLLQLGEKEKASDYFQDGLEKMVGKAYTQPID